ncbi:hypothetical protein DH2020_011604 [Rehmannia glutinosa]|uniref:Uncharacterized protein n=1 Tax=Rehmannia glutinosa TaxID=99300 RepID=A0ABR0XDY1_REHGL
MDPQYEQRLRDEVIYLHSLWHQGPPRPAAAVRHHLQPSQPTQFKKEKKNRRKRGKKSTNKPNDTAPESTSSPGAEWPLPTPPPPSSTAGWPSLEAKPDPKPITLSPEEQSKLASRHAHQHALKAVLEFFRYNNADDSDSIESSSDEDDELMEEDDGREEYSFFFKVFKEDNELREYYEKNFAKGEFSCLVCGALGGKKMGKKFKGCLALVQHSISIAKTKKRKAHRAFGQAVCKVLSWDINELSSIVSLLSDKSGETQRVNRKHDEAVPESGSIGTGILPNADEGDTGNGDNKESSMTVVDNVLSKEGDIEEGKHNETVPGSGSIGTGILPNNHEGDTNSLTCTDADKSLENLDMVHPHSMEEPAAEGLTNNSLACPDADKSLENLGMVDPHNGKEPASEELTNISLTCPDADKNLEIPAVVHPHNVEEPTTEGLTSVPLNENSGVGNETQDLEMDTVFRSLLNEELL